MSKGIYDRAPIVITGGAVDRFWAKVAKGEGSACWDWTAAKRSSGYGTIKLGGRWISAHRFSFVLHFGEIPVGKIVCHKCDNRSCVRPDHLFAGTPKENAADMTAKGHRATRRGEENGGARLTESVVEHLFALRSLGYSQARIASAVGVSRATVGLILSGKSWKHVSDRMVIAK